MIRSEARATCPHLTTPLYCVCREQGHDPARGCLVPSHLSARPLVTDFRTRLERCGLVEIVVSVDTTTGDVLSSA